MNHARISLDREQLWYRPGEKIRGTVAWHCDDAVEDVQLSLCWYTEGKGTSDAEIVASHSVRQPSPEGDESFTLQIPDRPYSFSGTLISLRWALELVIRPTNHVERLDLVIGPQATAIRLQPLS